MRKFKFKLEPVLEQRRRTEDEKQRAVALLERDRVALEDRLREVQRSIDGVRTGQREMLVGGGSVAVHGVRLQAGAAIAAMARANQLALELAGVLRRLGTARAELLRAAAATKAVELLKERQREEWRMLMARREIVELDEIAAALRQRTASEAEHS